MLSSQYYGSLDQLKNPCRDAGDCHHRPDNYDGICAPASARRSLRMRSYCLFTICKPSDDLSFHLVHRCNQMHTLTRAWQNASAMSSSVTFASPLSTSIHRKTERGIASPIDCHSTCLSFQTRFVRPAVSATIANVENGEVLKARSGKTRPDTSRKAQTRSTVDVPRRSKT